MPKAKTEASVSDEAPTTSKPSNGKGKGGGSKPLSQRGVKHEKREIAHPEPKTRICVGPKALDEDTAKALLGWQEETDKIKFGADYAFVDYEDKKVRCMNNMENRPITMDNVKKLAQEHLRKRWRLNGEPLVIGKTGQTINAQHRLVSLIYANQVLRGPQADYWKQFHDKPITMETIIVLGIDEGDDTVNTIDTGKPRSLDEVIYRCGYFNTMPQNDRKTISKMLSNAVKLVWERTGAGLDAYNPNRTHAEAIAFIDRHERLVEAVKHIFEENKDGSITEKLKVQPGAASGMLYLMASSSDKTDVDSYRESSDPSEHFIDFTYWDKACTFWVELVKGAKELKAIREAFGDLLNGGTMVEKRAIIAKAWVAYVTQGKVTPSQVKLNYEKDEDGLLVLVDNSKFGGIDIGNPKLTEAFDPEAPSESEIEEATNGIHAAKNKEEVEDELDMAAKGPTPKPSTPSPGPSPKASTKPIAKPRGKPPAPPTGKSSTPKASGNGKPPAPPTGKPKPKAGPIGK